VLAENPRPEDFDDSFAEPVQSEWARVSFLIVRNDLSWVEAAFIRPRAWIESLGLVKGARLDLAVPELKIDGLAEVTAVRACPAIADGEGRVVTGRFVTRDVANVVRITLANGTEIRATDVHPVWSVDREDWVPAGKLEAGEHVDTLTGPVAVASVEPLDRHPAVYNLEVHGEHVYRIAVDGVLVHNGCLEDAAGVAATHVYIGLRNNVPVYVGITNNIARRQAEHAGRFVLSQITSTPVTRAQARAIEQALLNRNPQFDNVIDSIAANREWYPDAVAWGAKWLKEGGFKL
jgi:hypothetical protein